MENSWEPVKTHDRWSIDGSFLERVIILELSPMAPENTKRSPWRPTSWCRACRRSWKVRPKVCRFSLGKFMGKSWETDFTRGWTGAANIFGKWYAFRSHTGRKARWSRVKGLKADRQQPTSPWQFSQFGTLWWRWNPLWLGYTPPFYTLFFFLSWLPFDVTWWFRGTIDRFLWSGYWLKLKHRHVGGESTGQPHEITILPPISPPKWGQPIGSARKFAIREIPGWLMVSNISLGQLHRNLSKAS